MKKLLSIMICAVMAFYLVACGGNLTPTENGAAQIPNPFVECDSISDAEEIAGFSILEPEMIPANFELEKILVIKDELVEILYKNGEAELIFRQGKGDSDISGDYTVYDENNELNIGDIVVETKGNSGKVNVAIWTSGEFSFAILGDSIDNTSISDMIISIKSSSVIGGDSVLIPNPFVECNTLEEAFTI